MPQRARDVLRAVRSDLAAWQSLSPRTERAIDAYLSDETALTLGLHPTIDQQGRPDMPFDRDRENQWHLDKRVPIAILGAILMQSAVAIWWASGIDKDVSRANTRLAAIEAAAPSMVDTQRRILALETSDREQTEVLRQVRELLARIDERLKLIAAQPQH